MGTVCATPLLLGLVNLNVWYVKWIHVQAFHLQSKHKQTTTFLLVGEYRTLANARGQKKGEKVQESKYFSIAFSILEQVQNKFCRFNRPTSLAIRVPVLGLRSSPNSSTETREWDCLFVDKYILQVPFSLGQRQFADSMRTLPSILVKSRNTWARRANTKHKTLELATSVNQTKYTLLNLKASVNVKI